MPFAVDPIGMEELDLNVLFQNVKAPAPNLYIADEKKAVELLAGLIRNDEKTSAHAVRRIRRYIDELFDLFEDIGIENGLELYEQFLDLCARLSAQQKIRKIQDKVVISFGGAFSAGKSKFINSISGINNILPVAQVPTTSIPTYIMKSDQDKLRANSIYGYATNLTAEAMGALTHEFYDVYGIGFSAFVDSVIVESSRFSLPRDIALLDTPGYTKHDEKGDSKLTISDRERAFEQLRASDYLIWLADIDSGCLTEEDLNFIKGLRIKTPILLVFTKADKKPESEIQSIIRAARETIDGTSIDCFGITAYSSNQSREYGGRLIPQFINFTLSGGVRENDVLGEFDRIEGEMRERIQRSIRQSRNTAHTLFTYIARSNRFLDIRSLVTLWGKANQEGYQLSNLLKRYEAIVSKTKWEIMEYIRRFD